MNPNDPVVAALNGLPDTSPMATQNQNQNTQFFQPPQQPIFGGSPALPPIQSTQPQIPQQQFQPQVPGQPVFMPQQSQQQQIQQQPQFTPQTGYPLNVPVIPQQQQPAITTEQLQELVQQQIQQAQGAQFTQTDKPWSNDKPPTNWDEFYEGIDKIADKRAEDRFKAWQTEQQQQQQQIEQQTQIVNQQFNTVETQLTSMGLLPQIADPNNPNDPGRQAKKELYAYAVSLGGNSPESLGPAAATLKALHDQGYYFDTGQNKLVQRNSQTPNAYAPIAGASMSMGGPTNQQGPTTREMATTDFSTFAAMGAQKMGLPL
jgi:hypothetical protein